MIRYSSPSLFTFYSDVGAIRQDQGDYFAATPDLWSLSIASNARRQVDNFALKGI
jgi:hypothetical protein